jgi:hypothetical protein
MTYSHGKWAEMYICHSEIEICALAANRAHQILAFAAVNGSACIHGAQNGTVLMQYETKEEIDHLVVTDGWGFFLALSRAKAFVFSVNGVFIKSEKLPLPFSRIFSHSAFGHFDFISFITQSNEIGMFEALYLESQSIL